MEIGICSYSFHRLLADGKQDIFQYIIDCKTLGATQLDPWNSHLAPLKAGDADIQPGVDPESIRLSSEELDYLDQIKQAAAEVDLPFGCLAVDGAHIYEPTPEARRANRARAYKWLAVAERLGAKQLRIDSGGPEEMAEDVFDIIVAGFEDLTARCRAKGIELIMENHWGASCVPENVIKILEAVEELGLLFDTNNWADGRQQAGWRMCVPYAAYVHIKTFSFDAQGNDPSVDIPAVINLLLDAGYNGSWGVESVPQDGNEMAAAQKTIALIKRVVEAS